MMYCDCTIIDVYTRYILVPIDVHSRYWYSYTCIHTAINVRKFVYNKGKKSPKIYAKLQMQMIRHLGDSKEGKTCRLLERDEIGVRMSRQFLLHLRIFGVLQSVRMDEPTA